MKAYLHALASRTRALFKRKNLEAEMAEEMRQHLEELTRSNIGAGMTPEEASYAAQRRFGGMTQIKERCRDEHGFVWLEQLFKDVFFSVRALNRARGFSLTVLFTIILGIGVTTVVYEITSWIIFRASPYPHSEQLQLIGFKDKQGLTAYYRVGLQFQAYQDQTDVFSEFAAFEPKVSNVVLDGEPVAATVFGTFKDSFKTLGVMPFMGRGFLPGEFKAGSDDVAVITYIFWRQHFNGDREVLGRKITIDQHICTIVGVLAQAQQFPPQFGADIYRPLVFKIDPTNVFYPGLFIMGRLKPGVTSDKALAELSAVRLPPIPTWASAFFADQKAILTNVTELSRPEIYWVLFAAAAFLYAIACLNAVNLMLIRLLGRRRELSIRFALGGSRKQVVQLLLVENLILSLAAFLIVAFAARWLFPPLFNALYGNDNANYGNFWNWDTLCFIGGLTALSGVLTALVPTIRLFRADINSGLKDGGPTLGEGRRSGRLRNLLVILQATFAVILMAGTGLMVRSFEKLHKTDLGFDPVGKVKVSIAFPPGYEPKPQEQIQLFERLQEKLGFLPGVKAVSYSQDSLLVGGFYGTAQLQMADGTFQAAAGNFVSADFQKTAGLTMLKGRWLSGKKGAVEVVINETLAKARFGDKDPIGQFIKIQVSGDMPYLIVGVVKNVRETMRASAGMRLYSPAWEYPPNIKSLILRLDRDPEKEFADVVRRAIYAVEPRLIATEIRSIDQAVSDQMWYENYAFKVLKGLSGIALLLTIVGLFSVIAYTVDSRMTEFGVRLAIGATPSDLNRLVMRRGLVAAAIGIALGTAGALGLTRFMESLLFETTPYDPLVYFAVALLLLGAAGLACWLPARRAARVDVVRLLRSD
jgi:putative ABC transport system permease protein